METNQLFSPIYISYLFIPLKEYYYLPISPDRKNFVIHFMIPSK